MSFRDLLGNLAGEVVRASVSGNGFAHSNGHPGVGRTRIEAICAELGWGIDERVGSDGVVLHFNDPLVRIRKVLVTCGTEGTIVGITSNSSSVVAPGRVPPSVGGYLLQRNCELAFPAWRMFCGSDGNVVFALSHCALLQGLSAGVFKLICESMVTEGHAFDQKMRESGLL